MNRNCFLRSLRIAFIAIPSIFFASCTSGQMTDAQLSNYVKAKTLYLQGDFDAVLKTLKVSDYSVSNGNQALLLVAKSYFMRYQPDKAEPILLRLTKHYPRYTEAQLWLIRSYLAQNKLDQAEKELALAMRFNGEDPRLMQLMASLHGAKKEYQKAFEYYTRVSDFADEIGKSEIELAQLYYRFGQKEKALYHVQRAKALISSDNVLSRALADLEKKIK